MNDKAEQHSPQETQRRLRKILAGAFAGPPTPLKEIPTRKGKPRKKRPAKAGGPKRA